MFRAQPIQLLQRLVVAPLAVVEEHERDARVDAIVAAVVGGILDERQALFASAAETGGVGHPAHRQRHGRRPGIVGADDQAGVAAALVELHHALVGVVGFAGRSERRPHAALDRRRERRAQSDRRAELVMRVRVARIRRDLLARATRSTRPVIASNSFSSSGGGGGSLTFERDTPPR